MLKNKRFLLILVVVFFCTVLLGETLLKTTFKSQVLFQVPALAEVKKSQVNDLIKNYSDPGRFLQIEGEFLQTSDGPSLTTLTDKRDHLSWEVDIIKLNIISEGSDENLITEACRSALVVIYNGLLNRTNALAKNYNNSLLKKLTKSQALYHQLLEDLILDRDSNNDLYKKQRLTFLLGQPKRTRISLLNADIEIIDGLINDLQKPSQTVDINEIVVLPGSYSVVQYGPHFKEFLIYCLVLVVATVLYFFDTKYFTDKATNKQNIKKKTL